MKLTPRRTLTPCRLVILLLLAVSFESRAVSLAPQRACAAAEALAPSVGPSATPGPVPMDDPLQPRPPAWLSAPIARTPSTSALSSTATLSATALINLMSADASLQAAICLTDTQFNLQEGRITVPILLYHFVGRETLERKGGSISRYNVTAADFEAQLALLKQLGYHTVTVSEIAAALLDGQTLPERPVTLTFDDGWSEHYSVVFPLLQKYGMKATFYVPSSYPVGKRFMTWEQLAELRDAGMEIGSHTRKHVNLLEVTDKVAESEITNSKSTLEKKLEMTVQTLAYPYGLYSKSIIALTQQAGYRAAVGLGGTLQHSQSNLYALPRIEIRGLYTLTDFVAHLPWRGQGMSLCPIIQPPAPSPDRQTNISSSRLLPTPQLTPSTLQPPAHNSHPPTPNPQPITYSSQPTSSLYNSSPIIHY